MTNQDILKALIDARLLGEAEAAKLSREAESLKRGVEEIIYSRNIIPQEEVAKVKSAVLKIPYRKIDPNMVKEDVLGLIPGDTARAYQSVPLSRTKDLLVIGMVHPDDPNAQAALKFLAKQEKINLGVYLVTPQDVDLVLKRFSPFSQEIQGALQSLNLKPGEGLTSFQKITRLEEGITKAATDAPIIRIVSSILREAVNLEASDIHIEPQRTRTRVRLRLGGDLEEFISLPAELAQSVIARIKVLSNLKLDETRVPQDGRFRTLIFEKEIDFRVSTFPTPSGEKAALRVLDPSVGLKNLDEIGIVGRNADLLRAGIAKPFGMVLLTGPTGSGKTTTLYALMRILNQEEVNVISLEDPVEYTIDGVNQSQVRPEIGYDFASGLRQILRQDPDTIMVGEIRDTETAGLAVHAALTGHIVLSTLHTNNAIGVIPRLIDMGVQEFLIASAMNLMAGQRLLSRLCERCRKPEPAPVQVAEIVKREFARLPAEVTAKFREPYQIFHAPGCTFCKGKGTSGRIAIFEVFQMTPELASIMAATDFTEAKIAAEAKRQGMISLRADGILKALDGTVSMEEVLRETEEL